MESLRTKSGFSSELYTADSGKLIQIGSDGELTATSVLVSSISGSNLQGSFALNTVDIAYTIPHDTLESLSRVPLITLQVPTSASNLMIGAITNRDLDSFDVILSQAPNTSGYYVNWLISD